MSIYRFGYLHGFDVYGVIRPTALTLLEDALHVEIYNRNEDKEEGEENIPEAVSKEIVQGYTDTTIEDVMILPHVSYMIGQVEGAWGVSIDLMFRTMGVQGDEAERKALTYLLMACIGHGVSLMDDWSEEFEAACKKLGKENLDDAPVHMENPMTEYAESLMIQEYGFPKNHFAYEESPL